MDIFKELTFKETSITTSNFRQSFQLYLRDFRIFFNLVYIQLGHSFYNLTFRQFDFVILLCIYFVLRFSIYARPHKLHSFYYHRAKIKAVCLSVCLSISPKMLTIRCKHCRKACPVPLHNETPGMLCTGHKKCLFGLMYQQNPDQTVLTS